MRKKIRPTPYGTNLSNTMIRLELCKFCGKEIAFPQAKAWVKEIRAWVIVPDGREYGHLKGCDWYQPWPKEKTP
jgi:hypothetical protein